MRLGLRSLGFSTALAALVVLGTPSANAVPVGSNGSFGIVPLGTVTATSSSGWEVGPNTTVVTIPSSELVNTTTNAGTYLGNPDNIQVPLGNFATLNYLTFNIPALNTVSTLGTPLTVTIANAASDVMTFTFTSVIATSSGDGALNLYWAGDLTGDTLGAFIEPSAASFSAAFTASNATAVGNVSFSLATPPAAPPPIPEPASIALLGVGTLTLGISRRRKRCGFGRDLRSSTTEAMTPVAMID